MDIPKSPVGGHKQGACMIRFTLTPRGLHLRVQFDPETMILLLILARVCQRLL